MQISPDSQETSQLSKNRENEDINLFKPKLEIILTLLVLWSRKAAEKRCHRKNPVSGKSRQRQKKEHSAQIVASSPS